MCHSRARFPFPPTYVMSLNRAGLPPHPYGAIRFRCWRVFRIAKRKKQACPYLESVNTKLENTRDDETGTLCNDSIASFLNCFQTHLRQVLGISVVYIKNHLVLRKLPPISMSKKMFFRKSTDFNLLYMLFVLNHSPF